MTFDTLAVIFVVPLVAGCAASPLGLNEGAEGDTSGKTEGGVRSQADATAAPFNAEATCTSGVAWTRGNGGSDAMNPGEACIACHASVEGPYLAVAGTLYSTAHEPNLCYGFAGADAQVIVIGADGQQVSLVLGSSGNFAYSGAIATPYQAKVVYMGRERAMIQSQTSGDCNACHTQSGAMNAPGRIFLP
jgi:hypothetical protein